jgi:hypothetical protein
MTRRAGASAAATHPEVVMRVGRLLAVAALLGTAAFTSFGPPWISIETPANPFDAGSRGAYLLVHAFHHGTPVAFPVSGTAEGIVDGARKTISLEFRNTSRPGVYALHKQWPDNGTWTLVLGVTQGEGDGNTAKAVVEIGANGQVASVDVPTVTRNGWKVPAPVSMAKVDADLRARAARLASR